MKINWKTSESMEKPREIDYESSPTTVYIRKDIELKTKDNIQGGGTIKYYSYKEAIMTPAEYSVYAATQQSENILAVMEAIVDIYDKIGEQ